MFHSRATTSTEARSMSAGELALREFFSHHDEALGNAAVLLADRRGARLLSATGALISNHRRLIFCVTPGSCSCACRRPDCFHRAKEAYRS